MLCILNLGNTALQGSRTQVDLSIFSIAIIVLAVGGIALRLEAKLVRIPAQLRAWGEEVLGDAPQADESSSQKDITFWSLAGEHGVLDLAVLQLLIGAGIVPILAATPWFASSAWLTLAVTAISEFIYLSYLGARMISLEELKDIARECQEIEARLEALRAAPKKKSAGEDDTVKRLESARDALELRAVSGLRLVIARPPASNQVPARALM